LDRICPGHRQLPQLPREDGRPSVEPDSLAVDDFASKRASARLRPPAVAVQRTARPRDAEDRKTRSSFLVRVPCRRSPPPPHPLRPDAARCVPACRGRSARRSRMMPVNLRLQGHSQRPTPTIVFPETGPSDGRRLLRWNRKRRRPASELRHFRSHIAARELAPANPFVPPPPSCKQRRIPSVTAISGSITIAAFVANLDPIAQPRPRKGQSGFSARTTNNMLPHSAPFSRSNG